MPCEIKMSRTQFKFLPAYAITVNSSQGRTLESAIVHLEGEFKNNVKAYVMLSRLTTGIMMGIIGRWHNDLFRTKPCQVMLDYLENCILPKEKITLEMLETIIPEFQALETLPRNALRV